MKEFLENDINSHYKLVYEFGYINLLFDNKSDSICYLVMSNLELMPSYQDDLLNLKDIEFLIIMKYKTDNSLLSISNKSNIHKAFYKKYKKGVKNYNTIWRIY